MHIFQIKYRESTPTYQAIFLKELRFEEPFIDGLVKSTNRRHSKKLQMQGARILRNEAYLIVRRNDERCIDSNLRSRWLWFPAEGRETKQARQCL